MGTRTAHAALIMLALLLVGGCSGQAGTTRTPHLASASEFPGGTCGDPSPAPSGGESGPPFAGLITVTRNPRSLLANWIPSQNAGPGGGRDPFSGPCRTVRTTASREVARRLAHDIDTARAFPSGTFNCPADFGVAVDLYFQLPTTGWQQVRVTLSGCPAVGGSDRRARVVTKALSTDINAMAPPPWHRSLDR